MVSFLDDLHYPVPVLPCARLVAQGMTIKLKLPAKLGAALRKASLEQPQQALQAPTTGKPGVQAAIGV